MFLFISVFLHTLSILLCNYMSDFSRTTTIRRTNFWSCLRLGELTNTRFYCSCSNCSDVDISLFNLHTGCIQGSCLQAQIQYQFLGSAARFIVRPLNLFRMHNGGIRLTLGETLAKLDADTHLERAVYVLSIHFWVHSPCTLFQFNRATLISLLISKKA